MWTPPWKKKREPPPVILVKAACPSIADARLVWAGGCLVVVVVVLTTALIVVVLVVIAQRRYREYHRVRSILRSARIKTKSPPLFFFFLSQYRLCKVLQLLQRIRFVPCYPTDVILVICCEQTETMMPNEHILASLIHLDVIHYVPREGWKVKHLNLKSHNNTEMANDADSTALLYSRLLTQLGDTPFGLQWLPRIGMALNSTIAARDYWFTSTERRFQMLGTCKAVQCYWYDVRYCKGPAPPDIVDVLLQYATTPTVDNVKALLLMKNDPRCVSRGEGWLDTAMAQAIQELRQSIYYYAQTMVYQDFELAMMYYRAYYQSENNNLTPLLLLFPFDLRNCSQQPLCDAYDSLLFFLLYPVT